MCKPKAAPFSESCFCIFPECMYILFHRPPPGPHAQQKNAVCVSVRRKINHRPATSQTAYYAPISFGHRPVKEDMTQTMEKQGAGKTIKRLPCACTEGEAFRLTVRRQPGTAISGSSLLSLYTTYVRVRVSAGKAAWALPPSFA